MTNDVQSDGPKERRLCGACVGESFLRTDIQAHGMNGVCSYCGQEGKTLSLEEMAGRVEAALGQHFYVTATEPDGLQYAMLGEGIGEWERDGELLIDVIQEEAKVDIDVAEDVQEVLKERHYDHELAQMGEEQPFGEEAQYARCRIDDSESQASWFQFERSLKTEARYFSRTAEWRLQSIFEGIADHRTRDGKPVVLDAGPGTRIPAIYRARVFQSDERLEEALKRPDIGIGPPPPMLALAGRMNPHGISVFYGATDPAVAIAEVRPPVASRVVVARFEIVRRVRLLDVEALRKLNVEGSIFDSGYISRLEKAKFLEWLSQRISMAVMPEHEPYEYLPTQVIADFLASNANPLLHGILYPSVQGGQGKANVVLFHKAARVQVMEIPEGTEISASSGHNTEDGFEVDYWVYEKVPPAPLPSPIEAGTFDAPILPLPFDRPPEEEERDVFLRLDVSSVQVHHVGRIEVQTDSYRVIRLRSQREDPSRPRRANEQDGQKADR